MSEVVHIASQPVQVGSHLRQRCVWCGEELVDQDLSLVAVAVEPGRAPAPYPTWPPGGLVARDGAATYVVAHDDGDPLPTSACVAPNDIRDATS